MAGDGDPEEYYRAFEDLVGVYLEDSWVLDIRESLSALVFTLDVVLAPEHPAYRAPKSGELHCCRRATLHVGSVSAIVVRRSSGSPAVDASEELDYGHIDAFRPVAGERPPLWELTGDWGEAVVREPVVRLQPEGAR